MSETDLKNVFAENCKKILEKFLEQNTNQQDITLMGHDGVPILSHKMILSACSPCLEKVIQNFENNNQEKDLVIVLPSYNSKEISSVIDFIHHGIVPSHTQVVSI